MRLQVVLQVFDTLDDELGTKLPCLAESESGVFQKNAFIKNINRNDFIGHAERFRQSLIVVDTQVVSEPYDGAAWVHDVFV